MNNIRELIAKHQKLLTALASIGVVSVFALLLYQLWGGSAGREVGMGFYLTTDDGATYINGSEGDLPPVDIGGKVAYAAHLGTQSDGQTKVFYMHRFTPRAREVLLKMQARQPVQPQDISLLAKGKEYKRPGDKDWKAFPSIDDFNGWKRSIVGTDKKMPSGLN